VLKLYFAPGTRAVRVRWLLEELDVPHEIELVTFKPTRDRFFIQDTPTGKIPTLVDGDVVMAESGAMIEYILGKYGQGRLAPDQDSPERARYLQWLHFAEGTAFPPLGILVWLTVYRTDADRHPELIKDARERARLTLQQVEDALVNRSWLLGDEFSAADVMMGFTLIAADRLGVLTENFTTLRRYLQRLLARPALQRSLH
jgi:glutathione S-transferase